MAALEQISRVNVEAKQTGLDAVAAGFDKVTAAQQRTAASGQSVATVQETQAKSTISVGRALDNYTRAHDPVTRALLQVERGEWLVSAARKQGLPVTDAANLALANARARHAELTRGMNDNAAAHTAHSATVGGNRASLMELTHVLKAVADETIATGQPLRALMLESGRLGQIMASSGGLGGALKQVGGLIGGLLSPTLLATGALAGLGAASAFAYLSYSAGQDKLARSLEGVGRATGTTLAGLNQIAAAGAKAGGISTGAGRDLAATYSGSGVLDGSQIGGLVSGTKAYARVLDIDLGTAAKRLADAMKDPSKGAADLNKELGFLDAATQRQIDDMQKSGNLMGAQNLLLETHAAAVAAVTDRTWSLSKGWEEAKTAAGNYFDIIGKEIAKDVDGPTKTEKLAGLLDLRKSNQAADNASSIGNYFGLNRKLGSNPALDNSIIGLQYQIGADAQRPYLLQQERDKKRLSQDAQPVADRYGGEQGDLSKLVNDQKLLSKALADGANLAPGAAEALERLNYKIANFTTSAQRAAQEGALTIKSIDAWTLSEKVAVDVERARTAALAAGKDALTTSIEVENARNAAIARANDTADKAAKSAADNLALAGLSPYQRALKENQFKIRDLREQTVLDKGDTTGLRTSGVPQVFERSKASIDRMADSADRAAASLAGLGTGGAAGTGVAQRFSGGIGSDAVAAMVAKSAVAHGIDPSTAVRVYKSEGAGGYVGDNGSSFGPFQLHYGGVAGGGNRVGGLGDTFTRITGLDARNPATLQQQIDFSLAQAAKGGWSPWHGAAKAGIGNFEGIDSSPVKSTAAGDVSKTARDLDASTSQTFIGNTIKAANDNISQQNKLLDAQISTFGKSTYEVNRAAKAQELLNQFAEQGVPVNGALRQSIDSIADATGALAQRQDDAKRAQQDLIASMDSVRGIARGALGTFVDDLAKGKSGAVALRDALAGIGQKLLSIGEDALISGLFGKSGTSGGGIFGSLLSGLFHTGGGGGAAGGGGGITGLFADGTDFAPGGRAVVGERGPEIVNLPRGAQVVPNHKIGGGGNVVSINSRGGDVIIQGNADSGMIDQIKSYIDTKQAEHTDKIQRNMGGLQSSFNKQYG